MEKQTQRHIRGHNAVRPHEIGLAGWKAILLRTKDEIADDHVSLMAAGVAFYALLATFPAIAAAISIAGMLFDPAIVAQQFSEWANVLPENAAEILQNQAQTVAGQANTSLGFTAIFSLLLALYGASKGVKTLIEGINAAYDEDETRSFIKLNMVSVALTVSLLFGLLVTLGISFALPMILNAVAASPVWASIFALLRWPLLALFAVAALGLLYRFGPAREDARWRWLTPGAILAVTIWIAATFAFAFYVRNFGTYNETYGTLGGVIILLTWLWLSAFIALLGAELNAEMERQTWRDTTTGEEQPMGQRGAEVADNMPDAEA